jgi:WD40 repeat protein
VALDIHGNVTKQFEHGDINDIHVDKKYLVSGSRKGTLKVWDIINGRVTNGLAEPLIGPITAHDYVIRVYAKGDYMFSGGFDDSIKVWSIKDGKLVQKFSINLTPWSILVDKNRLFVGSTRRYGGDIGMWNLTIDTETEESSNVLEEDNNTYTVTTTDDIEIVSDNTQLNCMNEDLITFEPFTKEDNPIEVYLPNSQGNFDKSICLTMDVLRNYLHF